MGIVKVAHFGNVVDVRSIYRVASKAKLYELSIKIYEKSFAMEATEFLAKKELLFLVACAVNFSEGNRKMFSKDACANYAEIANIVGHRLARNYLSNPKLQKWIIKTDEGYKLVPFLEKLIKSDTTNFNITIKHDQED